MEIVVQRLVLSGCRRIIVALNHMQNLIRAFFADGSQWGGRIEYSVEDRPLGTIGPLRLIEDLPEHFMVLNGDVLTDLHPGRLFERHVASGARATIAVCRRELATEFGVLEYAGPQHRITGFREKPVYHHWVSMGVYCFSRQILELIPPGELFGFDQLIDSMIRGRQDVRAFPHDGYWLDIGRPEDYARANSDYETLIRNLLTPENEKEHVQPLAGSSGDRCGWISRAPGVRSASPGRHESDRGGPVSSRAADATGIAGP